MGARLTGLYCKFSKPFLFCSYVMVLYPTSIFFFFVFQEKLNRRLYGSAQLRYAGFRSLVNLVSGIFLLCNCISIVFSYIRLEPMKNWKTTVSYTCKSITFSLLRYLCNAVDANSILRFKVLTRVLENIRNEPLILNQDYL